MKKGMFAAALLAALALPGFAADAKKGESAFNDNWGVCHNADSTDDKVGPGLKGLFKREKLGNGKPVNDANVKGVITDGSGGMPPFGDSISADDKDNIIAYLKTL
jgi:cytochrome c